MKKMLSSFVVLIEVISYPFYANAQQSIFRSREVQFKIYSFDDQNDTFFVAESPARDSAR